VVGERGAVALDVRVRARALKPPAPAPSLGADWP
jgi:hypothetical protein